MSCQRELREAGKPYPRTCSICGLGPCTKPVEDIVEAVEPQDKTKQVIVMRNDLNMRKGKMIAQGSHASMAFLTRRLHEHITPVWTKAELEWIEGSFAKVCVRANSEEELLEVYEKAKEAGLEVHLITDSGRTEFHGVPTNTCLAIGPDYSSKIDPITGELTLL